jgi:hypothetical protein
MASFTDNPQLLTNFNPYVQQLPVDAMVQVGMAKQQQYNEGIQKIQTAIDTVGGLDIAKDSDRAYLQSKINELGNNLKFVAAGDFSDFQLVNSVNGMTSQIAKDSNVQNAVASTAKLRKEQAFMEEQRKAGKSSPSNEWDFNLQASSWLNNSEIGQSFTGRYTPYIDVQKKYLEVFKSLHSDLTEQDIPYVVENGKVNYQKTAAAMQRISKESVSKEKIENALRASLTPAELEQLSIDGRYTFRDATPDQIAAVSVKSYNESIRKNEESIQELTGFANITGKSVLKEKALKAIESLKTDNEKLAAQVKEETEYALNNPESAKIMYYKNSSIQQFALANAWEHNKENVMANPVKQDEWEERKFAQAQTKLNLDISNAAWDKKMDILNYNLEKDKLSSTEKKELAKKKGEIAEFDVFFGENTDIGDPMILAQSALTNLQTKGDQIYSDLMKKTKASKAQIRNAVNAYKSGNKVKYAEAIKVIAPEYRNQIKKLADMRDEIRISMSALQTAENEANNSPEVIALQKELNKKLEGLGNHVIDTPNGKVSFTPQEMATYIGKRQLKSVGGAVVQTYSSPLTKKEKLLEKGTSSYREADSFARFSTLVPEIAAKLQRKRNEVKYKKFNELNQKWLPKMSNIMVGDGEGDTSRQFYEGIVSSLITGYNEEFAGQKGGSKYITQDELDELADLYATDSKGEKKNLQYKLFEQGDEKILVVVNGKKKYKLPMKEKEYKQLPIDTDNSYRDVRNAQKAQGGSTNNTNLFENSYFKKDKFPNTSFNIKADLKTGDGENQFVTLRINTEAGVINLPYDVEFASAENAVMFFNSITDADLIYAIKNADDDTVDPRIKALFK